MYMLLQVKIKHLNSDHFNLKHKGLIDFFINSLEIYSVSCDWTDHSTLSLRNTTSNLHKNSQRKSTKNPQKNPQNNLTKILKKSTKKSLQKSQLVAETEGWQQVVVEI